MIDSTLSPHCVHDGANHQYLDKSYGGILVLEDRQFGAFEEEVGRLRCGLIKNFNTCNPMKIGYHEFGGNVYDDRTAHTHRKRLRSLVRRPGWRPAEHVAAIVASLSE